MRIQGCEWGKYGSATGLHTAVGRLKHLREVRMVKTFHSKMPGGGSMYRPGNDISGKTQKPNICPMIREWSRLIELGLSKNKTPPNPIQLPDGFICFSDSATWFISIDQDLKCNYRENFNSKLPYPFDKNIERILYPLELIFKYLVWFYFGYPDKCASILKKLIHLKFLQSK